MVESSRNSRSRRAGRAAIRWSHAASRIAALAASGCFGVVAHAQTCVFNGSAGGIAFSAFDPSLAVTQSAFTDFKVRCTPSGLTPTWQFTGANGNAPFRMRNATQGAFIPYSVSVTRTGTSGSNQNWRVTASVLGSDYVNAPAGIYSDVLSATVLP